MKKMGVFVTKNGFKKLNKSGRKVDADEGAAILETLNVDIAEFLDEYEKRNAKPPKKAGSRSIVTGYSNYKMVHPDLKRLPAWGESDMKYFSRFKVAHNPTDNSIILLVDMGDSKYRVVYPGNSTTSTIRDLSSLCSKAAPLEGSIRKISLYDDLTEGMRELICRQVGMFRTNEIQSQEDFIARLAKYIPCSMLRNLIPSFIVKKVTVKENEDDDAIEYLEPHDMTFYDGDHPTDAIKFIANHLDILASRDELAAPMPKVFSSDPNEIAFNHIIPDELAKEGECPTWDQYLKRFSKDEAEAFMAFVYSIFDVDNTGRQMLYIYDPQGFGGKTMVSDAIADFLGPELTMSLQKDSLNNQFSLAKVWDKRLVTIDDNKNPRLVWTEKFHMLLGRGRADIEMKGKNSFSMTLQCKAMANGNVPLEIHPDALHEKSRVIMIRIKMTDEILKEFCKLDENGNLVRRPNGEPIRLGDAMFGKNLYKEMPQFLYKCKPVYKRLCPKRCEIILTDELENAVTSNVPLDTMMYADMFDTYLEYDADSTISIREFNGVVSDYMSSETGSKNKSLTNVTNDGLRDYIKKIYPDVNFSNVQSVKVEGGKRKTTRCVKGLRLKGQYPTSQTENKPTTPKRFVGEEPTAENMLCQ